MAESATASPCRLRKLVEVAAGARLSISSWEFASTTPPLPHLATMYRTRGASLDRRRPLDTFVRPAPMCANEYAVYLHMFVMNEWMYGSITPIYPFTPAHPPTYPLRYPSVPLRNPPKNDPESPVHSLYACIMCIYIYIYIYICI